MRATLDRAARGGERVHREHLQNGRDPPVLAALRLRLVEVGAARPHPERGGRIGPVRHPGQRRVPRTDRDADARRRYAGKAGLVSEAASFVTGSELVIDGGQCLQLP
jgi:hypothetical protein